MQSFKKLKYIFFCFIILLVNKFWSTRSSYVLRIVTCITRKYITNQFQNSLYDTCPSRALILKRRLLGSIGSSWKITSHYRANPSPHDDTNNHRYLKTNNIKGYEGTRGNIFWISWTILESSDFSAIVDSFLDNI